MTNYSKYEVVVGLEVHAQLQTVSKLFCGDSIAFGAEPNTHISPITLGHPGTLPKMNHKAVEYAIRMGLACHCEIEKHNYFARKNYFYPDLPKGYQVSQHTTPICKGGYIRIVVAGNEKKIRLNRIHLEEDAGKSIHDIDDSFTCVDYNRAGTPLIEIVTEPDIRSSDEAFAYLTEVRKLVRYLNICDGNMEEGSLRCDANISVRLTGDEKLGTKVEVKNLNSIRNVKKAIEIEANRLIEIIESGGTIKQQTRSYNANDDTTFSIRDKEDADDYRYFAEPDLTPFSLKDEFIDEIRKALPVLPEERKHKYVTEYSLSEYDAALLSDEKEISEYYEAVIQHTSNYKAAANWLNGPLKTWMNEQSKEIADIPVSPSQLASVIELVQSGKISFSAASTKLLNQLLMEPGTDVELLAQKLNILQESDTSALEPIVDAALAKMEGKVAEYKKGKKGLLALFVGEVMKLSKGKADPKVVNELLLKKLNS